MSALDPWRREIRALIPRGFLRRDQGNALFVSDYPRFSGAEQITAALAGTGFRTTQENGIARISPEDGKARAFLRALPCMDATPTDETLFVYCLARRLIRQGGTENEDISWLPGLLKRLDEGRLHAAAAEMAAEAALRQRLGAPLPAAAGRLLMLSLAERKGEESEC